LEALIERTGGFINPGFMRHHVGSVDCVMYCITPNFYLRGGITELANLSVIRLKDPSLNICVDKFFSDSAGLRFEIKSAGF
jgi:hypothetical protein